MSRFEFKPVAEQSRQLEPSGWEGLGGAVLLQNARWFIKIRWAVIVALILLCLTGRFFASPLSQLGLHPPAVWPCVIAAGLFLANIGFLLRLRWLNDESPRPVVAANLWQQITYDLLLLTVMVHYIGSTNTFFAFTYLFHITLACIFFVPARSLIVVLLAAFLYVGCVVLEVSGILPRRSVIMEIAVPHRPAIALLFAASAVFVWALVWYMVSSISAAVRLRDRRLAAANRQLVLHDQEKNMLTLRTTHDLKAPFSGIESNIQILRHQHWDAIPTEVQGVIERIERRSEELRNRINDILFLGGLRSETDQGPQVEQIDLKDVLQDVINDLDGKARQRGVTVEVRCPSIPLRSDPAQLRALLSNLLANAINYSREQGTVEVSAAQNGATHLRVSDHGIGISDRALPHIFEEYYRAKEASRFNPSSTGLGLAIVKQVVQNLSLEIVVDSREGLGTTFDVVIPDSRPSSPPR